MLNSRIAEEAIYRTNKITHLQSSCPPPPQSHHPSPGVQLTGGNRQIRPTHVSIFNRLLDQFRHRLVAVNHVMRAAGKIGDSGLVRIDAHVVIEGRVHFTKMHGPIGNRGA